MTPTPVLRITDGTTTIDLLSIGFGFHLREWTPAIAEPKDGGVFSSNPLVDGRQLTQRVLDNTVEPFTLALNAADADDAIWYMQELRRLLTKAHQYWTTEWANAPVWIEAKAAKETNLRYAVIVDWRLQKDGNPFSQPFFTHGPVVMDNLDLAIERDHWTNYSPGLSDCLNIKSIDPASVVNTSVGPFEIAASADDATVNFNGSTIDLTGDSITLGGDGTNWYAALFRFTNVNVPAGATITDAYIRFRSPSSEKGHIIHLVISGERSVTPATFSTYANYAARTKTLESVAWSITNPWANQGYYNTPDLSSVVQEIIDLPGWAANNEMAIFIVGSKLEIETRDVWSYNGLSTNAAELYVTYRASEEAFGQEETCTPYAVHVANKSNQAQIDTIFMYENGVGYTDLLAASLPYNLLPTSATIGDYLYIGVDSTTAVGGPFNSVVFDLAAGLEGIALSLQWEYSDSATPTWAALASLKDNTNELQEAGINSLHFIPPSDWTAALLNGVTAYWIRLNITAGTAGQLPQQQNRHPYTVIHPYFDIEADTIGGDLSALILMYLQNRGYSAGTNASMGGFHIGTRGLGRGEEFSAFFNASNEQHQPGVSAVAGASTTLPVTDIVAPTGKRATYNPGSQNTTPVTQVTWQINYPYSAQYRGRYRVFLRYAQDGGADGDFNVRLGYVFGSSFERFTELVTVPKPNAAASISILELGQVVFPGILNEDVGTIYLDLQFASLATSSWGDVYIYDLILLPYDEWTGSFYGYDAVYQFEVLKIDPISIPKEKTLAVKVDAEDNYKLLNVWSAVENNIPSVPPNKAMRVWILTDRGNTGTTAYTRTDFHAGMSVAVNKVQRYSSMRGGR